MSYSFANYYRDDIYFMLKDSGADVFIDTYSTTEDTLIESMPPGYHIEFVHENLAGGFYIGTNEKLYMAYDTPYTFKEINFSTIKQYISSI